MRLRRSEVQDQRRQGRDPDRAPEVVTIVSAGRLTGAVFRRAAIVSKQGTPRDH